MQEKLKELEKTVHHLDLLNQFAIAAAERENPGFTAALNNLAVKVERLRKAVGI